MIIESIEPVGRNKELLMLDSGEKLVLYKGELRLLKIKGPGELSDDTYSKIVNGILPKRAKFRAMNLLKSRAYTEYQLRLKLREGAYPDDVIDQAVSYVKQFGYINDRAYAIAFIEEQRTVRSRKEIQQKLLIKGVDTEVIEAAFLSVCDDYESGEEETFDEVGIIRKALEKKGFTGNEAYEDKQKLLGYFYRKGFSMDHVYKAMESFKE